ncbi:MAG: iron ABC transporter permease, partial [Thaumarchaeota archaeon]|nr:iron ABC transporter permease [Nitrososphaerota archaeon]
SRPGAPGFLTLANYAEVLANPAMPQIIANTLVYSLGASILANSLGLWLAFTVTRTDAPLRKVLAFVPIITLVTPVFLDNLAWIHLLSPNSGLVSGPVNAFFRDSFGFKDPVLNIYTIWGMIWTTGTAFTPITYLVISGPLARIDPRLEEASRLSGANNFSTFLRVTLPLLWPALLSSFLLTFIIGLETFDTPAFIGIPAKVEVLTTNIYRSIVNLAPPEYGIATATSFLLLSITLVVLYLYGRATRLTEKYVTVSATSGRPSIIKLGKWRKLFGGGAVVYLLVHPIPIFTTIIVASFHRFWNPNFLFKVLTFDNYTELPLALIPNFDLSVLGFDFAIPSPVVNSFIVSSTSAIAISLAGFFVTYMFVRSKGGLRKLSGIAASVPLGFPTLVLGVGLLWALISLPGNLYGTVWAMTIAYSVRYVPISLRFLTGPMLQLHRELEEASRVCGGGWLYTIRHVVLPNMKSPIIALGIYAMIISFKDLGAAVMLVTHENRVLSAAVFAIYNAGEPLTTAAAAVVYVVLLTLVILSAWVFLGVSPLALTRRDSNKQV